jgi:hypothetical protein
MPVLFWAGSRLFGVAAFCPRPLNDGGMADVFQ